jgi:hypothetical protein
LEPRASPQLPQSFHLPFSTDRIATLEDEAFSHFSERQHMALQNIVFCLNSADERNRNATQTEIHSERVQLMDNERGLLKHGGELIDAYLSGRISDTGGVAPPPSAAG